MTARLRAIAAAVPPSELIEDAIGAVILFGAVWIVPDVIAIAKVMTGG